MPMSFKIFFVILLILFPILAFGDDSFTLLDSDKDGKISGEEFKVLYSQLPEVVFNQVDKDKDTFLSLGEYNEFIGLFNSAGELLLGPITSSTLPVRTEPLVPMPPIIPQPSAPTLPFVGNITLPDVILMPSQGSSITDNFSK